MNTLFKSFMVLFLSGMLFTACNNAPEGEKVDAKEAQTVDSEAQSGATQYAVDASNSLINWTGAKVTKKHVGTLKVKGGNLLVEDGKLVGGSATIDMESLTVLDDMGPDMKAKLTRHLKSDDFFDIGNHPTGKFEITKVEAASGNPDITHQVTGNLTLRGTTKSITIPSNIVITEQTVSAVSTPFTINRTDWGANYESKLMGAVGDAIIYDEVGIVLNLTAQNTVQ